MTRRSFLFLQGPASPFFTEVAYGLVARGHRAAAIVLCVGDSLFWRGPETLRFRGALDSWPGFFESVCRDRAVTDLVLLGEQREHHRLAIAVAHRLGIGVTVTDFGYLRPDWINLERDGMSGNSRLPRDPETIRDLAEGLAEPDFTPRFRDSFWRMALAEMAFNFSNFFLSWLFPHYRRHKPDNPVLEYLATGWRMLRAHLTRGQVTRLLDSLTAPPGNYFVFPLQVAFDFQLRVYSPYPDQRDALATVIRSFAAHAAESAQLVIKVHPWDNGLRDWRRCAERIAATEGVAGRVHYIDGGDLDRLIRGARGMVTVNSTSGLRALQLGCPTLVLGQAVFDVPGLTHQGGLDAFWRECAVPDARLLGCYFRLLAATTQVRGVFFARPGLDAAVAETVARLDAGAINCPLAPEVRA